MSDFIHQQHPLILASASKARFELLSSLNLRFEVIPSNCDEEKIKQCFNSGTFLEMALLLASTKALELSQLYPQHFVIAADQLCVIDDQYLDKPLTHANAVNQLRLLSGKSHRQIATTCIAKRGSVVWNHSDVATLTMHELSDKTIEAYLRLAKPYQSCGAYHYEGAAKWLFKDVQGSDSTILGLPLLPLTQAFIHLEIVKMP
ncbi:MULTISPECIES: Maf family protein [Legionella]|uniref:Nucleoside triphosphate pyrophosphatase n=1 Tax=Legionella maceachernii TaxID=466 RepID=A0A0W0VZC6_9GAMM|nr:nucleoside triphosphate pyrophosphatase [Legionella maceachernii]KTD25652.1 Maf-like protein [Legionella maceachernii]SJZ58711.1 septum formation protein [Legionella maceachernii]SUP00736.1 Septum formation protein Maf [Legionella maceachernii]